MKNLISIGVPSLIAYLSGIKWEFFYVLLIIFVLDTITGVISGMKNGEYSSKRMKQGLLKKLGEVIVIFSLIFIQRLLVLNGISIQNIPIFEFAVTAFCFKEVSSIIENWIKMGVNIPSPILKWFKITQDNFLKEGIKNKASDKNE